MGKCPTAYRAEGWATHVFGAGRFSYAGFAKARSILVLLVRQPVPSCSALEQGITGKSAVAHDKARVIVRDDLGRRRPIVAGGGPEMIAVYRTLADSVGGAPRLTVDGRNLKIAGLLERQCLGLIELAVDGHRW